MTAIEQEKLQRERDFHNEWARSLDINDLLVRESFESTTAIENRYAFEQLGDVRGKKVLDLGCGAGETSVYFALQGAEVYACDISEEFLAVAERLAQKYNVTVRFSLAEAGSLPYPDDTFDSVFGNGVLHHVELSSTAKEVRRVLKTGGMASFIEPLPYNPVISIYRMMASGVRSADEKPLHFGQLRKFASGFSSSTHREFWLFSLLLFFHFFFVRRWHPSKVRYWKRVIEIGDEYKRSFLVLQRIDNFCLKYLPFLRYLYWNTVLVVKK